VSEQVEYMYKMGSHTARFASVQALLHEKTGDAAAREKAFRSFNWASYMCDRRGVVRVGPVESSHWFSDGYGDYIRHFMAGMGAVPEWAPPGEDHLVRSSSVVTEVAYRPRAVRYLTFDACRQRCCELASSRGRHGGRAASATSNARSGASTRRACSACRRSAARQVVVRRAR
jgi:hypothetical protein